MLMSAAFLREAQALRPEGIDWTVVHELRCRAFLSARSRCRRRSALSTKDSLSSSDLAPCRRCVPVVPAITNDGLTIAKIELSNPLDKLGEALATASMPPAVPTST
jgi:hypothetical protein